MGDSATLFFRVMLRSENGEKSWLMMVSLAVWWHNECEVGNYIKKGLFDGILPVKHHSCQCLTEGAVWLLISGCFMSKRYVQKTGKSRGEIPLLFLLSCADKLPVRCTNRFFRRLL
jgi:hypothetical protein